MVCTCSTDVKRTGVKRDRKLARLVNRRGIKLLTVKEGRFERPVEQFVDKGHLRVCELCREASKGVSLKGVFDLAQVGPGRESKIHQNIIKL